MDGAHLMHRIVLLSILNEVPGSHTEQATCLEVTHRSSQQRLDVEQELRLVEAFAFLASTTDDPRKVIAIAIEANEPDELVVRLATNYGSVNNVQIGLQGLAGVLTRSARAGQHATPAIRSLGTPLRHLTDVMYDRDATELFFREAATLHQNRILARLRSKHAVLKCNYKRERRLKPKIIPQLHSAMSSLKQSDLSYENCSEYQPLVAAVDSMHAHFISLEGFPRTKARSRAGLEVLLVILKACHDLHSRRVLPKTLNNISALAADSKIKLLTTIAKLSRYWTISKFLLKSAKESRLFYNIKIQSARYNAQVPLMQELDLPTSRIVELICNGDRWKHTLSRKRLRSEVQVHAFVSHEASLDCPVHAEMQLLWYYETTYSAIKPRVIRSSKKAYFLYNLFFNLHGDYVIPATHGRLYTKWGLPSLNDHMPQPPGIRRILDKIVNELDKRLQDEQTSPQRLTLHPCESALFPSAACSYTNQSDSVGSLPTDLECFRSLPDIHEAHSSQDHRRRLRYITSLGTEKDLTGLSSSVSAFSDPQQPSSRGSVHQKLEAKDCFR